MRFYLETKILRRNIPLFASFKVSYECNLSCAACPFNRRADEPQARMSWDTAIRALDALKARGTRTISFEGGEPLLWRDGKYRLQDLVEYAKRRFLRVAVTTNGIFPLDVPADIVWISIDGLRETHNRLRSASFDRLWHNLRTATGPARLMVHFTMNRLNWRELEGLARKLKELPAVKGLSLQLFYPYGQGESDLALSDGERRAALERAIELKKVLSHRQFGAMPEGQGP